MNDASKKTGLFYIIIILAGLVGSLGLWLPAFLAQKGVITAMTQVGYPARLHTEWMLFTVLFPAMIYWSINNQILHNDFVSKPQYTFVFLGGLIVLFFLLATPFRAAARGLASLLLFLYALEMLPYRTNHHKHAGWLFYGSLFGSLGALLWSLSSMDKYARIYPPGESLLYFGYPLMFSLAILSSVTEKSGLTVPVTRQGFLKIELLSIYIFSLTFLIEIIFLLFLRKSPPLPITGFIRLAVVLYWFFRGSYFKNFKKSLYDNQRRTLLIGAVMILTGLVGFIIGVEYRSHYIHLMFIGGILPIIYAGITKSKHAMSLFIITASTLIAATGRAFAIPSREGYLLQVVSIALFLLIALSVSAIIDFRTQSRS